MTAHERLMTALEFRIISPTELSRRSGMGRGTFYKWIKAQSDCKLGNLSKAVAALDEFLSENPEAAAKMLRLENSHKPQNAEEKSQ